MKWRRKPAARLQLTVFAQHRPAFVADAPAMGGKRRTAVQEIAPAHAASAVTKPSSRRPARRQFGKIDRVGGGGGNSKQKTCGQEYLHPQSSLMAIAKGLVTVL